MKKMAIENIAKNLEALIRLTPKEQVLLTRNGEPFAFVSDATKYDWEEIGYMSDPEFWEMIAERRREKTVPFEQVLAELAQKEKSEKSMSRRRVTGKHRAKNGRSAA
jgi:hypothetical protein